MFRPIVANARPQSEIQVLNSQGTMGLPRGKNFSGFKKGCGVGSVREHTEAATQQPEKGTRNCLRPDYLSECDLVVGLTSLDRRVRSTGYLPCEWNTGSSLKRWEVLHDWTTVHMEGLSDAMETQECMWSLEAGKHKKMDFPWSLQEVHGPANTWLLAHWDPCWTSAFRTAR